MNDFDLLLNGKTRVRLYLEYSGEDVCVMCAGFTVVTFNRDGTLSRIGSVPSDLGFQLNGDREIIDRTEIGASDAIVRRNQIATLPVAGGITKVEFIDRFVTARAAAFRWAATDADMRDAVRDAEASWRLYEKTRDE